MALSSQTLGLADRRTVAAWAADCAEHVLGIYEDALPGDTRVRAAIDQARAFATGALDVSDAVRQRGGQAGADAVIRSEVRRQVAAMTAPVARALASLPALGANRSGPLGPGRLSGGHVGEAVRAIQAQLEGR